MSRTSRFFLIALILGVVMVALVGVAGISRLAADHTTPNAEVPVTHILSGQKPRAQKVFSGNDATFTVSITNTGTVALQNVSVGNATTTTCNRTEIGPLNPGQSTTYACTRTDVTQSFLNELQVSGTGGGNTATHVSNAYVQVHTPEIQVIKQPETQTIRPGATAQFRIIIANSSPDIILTNIQADDNLANQCDLNPTIPVNLAPGDSIDYNCALANIQTRQTTIITARGTGLLSGTEFSASDVAWVEILDLTASLTPEPATVPEPGGLVTFNVKLTNPGSVPVTLVGLTTNQYGNILDSGNPQIDPAHNTCLPLISLPVIPPSGGSYSCSFVASVSGQPSNFSVILTATAKDRNNLNVSATANTSVPITNVAGSLGLTLGADPPFINPPSRSVSYSVRVDNNSEADSITLTQLQDSLLGSLDGRGSCDLPVPLLEPGDFYECTFTATVAGQAGQERSRTITISGLTDDPVPETVVASETVTVGIINQPTQEVFMPQIADDVVGSSCNDAYPLSLNRRYSFFPPAKGAQSVFRFTLPRSGSLRVELTNFVPRAGQLVVWTGNCGSLVLIGRNPDTALNKTVDLGTRPGGPGIQYIIQIINDGPTNNSDLYNLFVRFQ